MSEGWQIAIGCISIIIGLACLSTFIPLTAMAIWYGWDGADDVLEHGRSLPQTQAHDLARWRRPAYRLGYRMYELNFDRKDFERFKRRGG